MFKPNQQNYFSKYQPHLEPVLSNYTLKVTRRVVDRLGLKTEDSVLEIGCGSGRFTLPLLEQGLKVTGVDFSKELLEKLELYRKKNLKIIEADIDDLSLVKEKFAFACGFFVLHHLDDIKKSLRSLKVVLKKTSKIAFVEPNPLNPQFYIQPFISKNMSWNEEKGFLNMRKAKLEEAFDETGYKNFAITTFGFFPPFVVNSPFGYSLDNFLENQFLLKPFLPFSLIYAELK